MGRLTFFCVMATLANATSALGQSSDPREAQARKDCLTGKADAGVALLAEMFIESKNPNLIYNQARCYEQNGRAQDAINRFREYLRVAKRLTAEEKAEVEKHIADCRAMKTEQTPTPAPVASPPAAPPPQIPAAVAAPGPAGVNVTTRSRPAPPDSGRRLRLAGLVTGGIGLAAVATGGVMSYLVSSAKQEAEDNARKQVYDADLDSRGQTYETMQWVCYGTGAALVATGVVLYTVGALRRSQEPSYAVLPAVKPGHAGLLLQGSF